jgi:hypothetical protein
MLLQMFFLLFCTFLRRYASLNREADSTYCIILRWTAVSCRSCVSQGIILGIKVEKKSKWLQLFVLDFFFLLNRCYWYIALKASFSKMFGRISTKDNSTTASLLSQRKPKMWSEHVLSYRFFHLLRTHMDFKIMYYQFSLRSKCIQNGSWALKFWEKCSGYKILSYYLFSQLLKWNWTPY